MLRGAAPVVACGVVWAVFCLALDASGHAPGRAPLPGQEDGWYRIQAALLVPVLLGMWAVLVHVAHLLARRAGGDGARAALWHPLGHALGLSLLLLFVLPDIVVWQLLGFDRIGGAMLVYGPLCVLLLLGSTAAGLRRVHHLPAGRALGVAAGALLPAALFASLFLR